VKSTNPILQLDKTFPLLLFLRLLLHSHIATNLLKANPRTSSPPPSQESQHKRGVKHATILFHQSPLSPATNKNKNKNKNKRNHLPRHNQTNHGRYEPHGPRPQSKQALHKKPEPKRRHDAALPQFKTEFEFLRRRTVAETDLQKTDVHDAQCEDGWE
jgi:hypothetical protein